MARIHVVTTKYRRFKKKNGKSKGTLVRIRKTKYYVKARPRSKK